MENAARRLICMATWYPKCRACYTVCAAFDKFRSQWIMRQAIEHLRYYVALVSLCSKVRLIIVPPFLVPCPPHSHDCLLPSSIATTQFVISLLVFSGYHRQLHSPFIHKHGQNMFLCRRALSVTFTKVPCTWLVAARRGKVSCTTTLHPATS